MKGCLKTSLLIFLSIISFQGACLTQEYEEDIVNNLSKVDYFSLGFNGFVAKESNGEKYFKNLSARKDARQLFFNIVKNPKATPEAKLYAACGLRRNSGKDINSLFQPYFNMDVSILTADILR